MTGRAGGGGGDQPAVADHAVPAPGATAAIGLVSFCAFIMILNETSMGVAIPQLVRDLDVTVGDAQWLTSGFLLVMAVMVPMTGYLLQRLPSGRIYLTAMSLFTAGTVLCAAAPGFTVLLLGRLVQASGTAVMAPLLTSMVLSLIPTARRGTVMGTTTMVIGVAPTLGPSLSGFVLTTLDWRWIFLVNLPLAVLALAAGLRWPRIPVHTRRVPLDVVSVPLCALTFGGLVVGLGALGDWSERGTGVWLPLGTGVLAGVVFVARQIHLQADDRALLDLRPLGRPAFVVALALLVLTIASLFAALILLPLYLQNVLKVDPFTAGLTGVPAGIMMAVLGPVTGRMYDRLGIRALLIPGTIVLGVTFWAFSLLDVGSSVWSVTAIRLLLILGLSLVMTPLIPDALARLPEDLTTHGTAIVSTLQQLAAATGTALSVMVVSMAGGSDDGTGAGTHSAFLCVALVASATVPMGLVLVRLIRMPAHRRSDEPTS